MQRVHQPSIVLVLILSVCGWADAQDPQREHPLTPAIQMAQQSLAVMDQIKDYECQFNRRELVNQQYVSQRTLLRLRHQPFSVYMKFMEPAPGREVLYVAGQNQGKLLAHEASGLSSLVGTISLAVNSPTVMAETRHPITDTGMKRLVELVIAQWELESKYGEIDVKFYPDAKMGNSACEVIEASHPRPRKQFAYHLTRVYIDKQTRFPIRVENYGFPPDPGQQPILIEEYTYTNVRVNNQFTESDFDRSNPKYSF